jgi:hypothetical protein
MNSLVRISIEAIIMGAISPIGLEHVTRESQSITDVLWIEWLTYIRVARLKRLTKEWGMTKNPVKRDGLLRG